VPLADRTVMSAFGRPLFVCHSACAKVAQDAVAAVGRVALAAGTVALKKRAPQAVKTFEALRLVIAQRQASFATPVAVEVKS